MNPSLQGKSDAHKLRSWVDLPTVYDAISWEMWGYFCRVTYLLDSLPATFNIFSIILDCKYEKINLKNHWNDIAYLENKQRTSIWNVNTNYLIASAAAIEVSLLKSSLVAMSQKLLWVHVWSLFDPKLDKYCSAIMTLCVWAFLTTVSCLRRALSRYTSKGFLGSWQSKLM